MDTTNRQSENSSFLISSFFYTCQRHIQCKTCHLHLIPQKKNTKLQNKPRNFSNETLPDSQLLFLYHIYSFKNGADWKYANKMFPNREEAFECLIVSYFNKKLFKVNERRNEANQNGMVFNIQNSKGY